VEQGNENNTKWNMMKDEMMKGK